MSLGGGYGEDAVVHAWQDTNDRQDHERIQTQTVPKMFRY